ncbi:MAG: hypothetical protein Q8P11_04280 [bacterium]|nr:hypothetical protein [bacterium]
MKKIEKCDFFGIFGMIVVLLVLINGTMLVSPVFAETETMVFDPLKTKPYITLDFTLAESKADGQTEEITVDGVKVNSGMTGYVKIHAEGLLSLKVTRSHGLDAGRSELDEECKTEVGSATDPATGYKCKKLNDIWAIVGYEPTTVKGYEPTTTTYVVMATTVLYPYQRVLHSQAFTMMNKVTLINESDEVITESVTVSGRDVNFNVIERSLKINVRPATRGTPVSTPPQVLKEDLMIPNPLVVQQTRPKWGYFKISTLVLQNTQNNLSTGSISEVKGGVILRPTGDFTVTPTLYFLATNAAAKDCGLFAYGSNTITPGVGLGLALGDTNRSLQIGPFVRYHLSANSNDKASFTGGIEGSKVFSVFNTEITFDGTAIIKNIHPIVVTGWVDGRIGFLKILQAIVGFMYQNEPTAYLGLGAKFPILESTMTLEVRMTVNGILFGGFSWEF